MSEYQFYEFRAVDRSLSESEMRELRKISTRAEITARSFRNEYNWGDLKADPPRLVEKYFDLHVYVTNWGTRDLLVRLPAEALSLDEATEYCHNDSAQAWESGEHTLLGLGGDDDDYEDWEEGEGWLDDLAGVRDELMAGDLRALYLGWLLAVEQLEVEDDAEEPEVPPGLGSLSSALDALRRFLRVDEHLVAAAAEGSPELEPGLAGLREWIASLPPGDKDELLHQLATGDHARARAAILRRFRDEAHGRARDASRPRRTAEELLARAAELREAEEREQARAAEAERRRLEEIRAAAREKRLTALAERIPEVWQDIEGLVSSTNPKSYDEAVDLLVDLRELAIRSDEEPRFLADLRALRDRHGRKPSFLGRLEKAGL